MLRIRVLAAATARCIRSAPAVMLPASTTLRKSLRSIRSKRMSRIVRDGQRLVHRPLGWGLGAGDWRLKAGDWRLETGAQRGDSLFPIAHSQFRFRGCGDTR